MPPRTWLEKADRYLASAELLLVAEDYESAVSRAYYAARYAAIHLLLARKVGWQPKWQHETVGMRISEQARNLQWLRAVTMTGQLDFGRSWLKLLEYRSRADYDLGKINERIGERCLLFAQTVIRAIKENAP